MFTNSQGLSFACIAVDWMVISNNIMCICQSTSTVLSSV